MECRQFEILRNALTVKFYINVRNPLEDIKNILKGINHNFPDVF